MSTELVISFEIDGLHFWPNAPKQYEEFSHPHRHLFKFICWYPQKGNNDPTRREKELWELRQGTISYLNNNCWIKLNDSIDFGSMSCEGIAQTVKQDMNFSKVFVGEEWFLGAIVQ